MSEIPEDVMQSARALHIALFDHCRDIPAVRMNLEDIARAIMAERERAANIAQTHIPEGIHPDDLYRWRDTAGAIAAAIRNGN